MPSSTATRKPSRKRPLAAAALALLITSGFATRKTVELSADPEREKDCGPAVIPGDPSKATQIALQPTAQPLRWLQRGGTINDASCLNRTPVHGRISITSADDVRAALAYARESKLKVSMAGVRHSMGGQAFATNALVLDMTGFNAMSLDAAKKVLTVQSGATWRDIQKFLHPRFAVKAMQSTNIFTVGGSISVNAHGMDHQVGAISRTIRAMRVMLPDGTVKTASRSENPELFNLVVGGYGLFGVILDVELDVADNLIYAPGRAITDYARFAQEFENNYGKDASLGLFYGHLSTAPQNYLRELILYTYREQPPVAEVEVPPLGEVSATKLRRFTINFAKLGTLAQRIKWFAEVNVEPLMESCSISRNQAMKDGEACLVSRNEPMNDSVKYLQNNLPAETDILQEYFVPRENFASFVDGLRETSLRNNANVLNASVRVVHAEQMALNYAPRDAFSVVLYVNQSSDDAGNAGMARFTSEMIDLTTRLQGRFFLPYQLHYTPAQLRAAYPEADAFFAAKRRLDPGELLTSTWYERYGR